MNGPLPAEVARARAERDPRRDRRQHRDDGDTEHVLNDADADRRARRQIAVRSHAAGDAVTDDDRQPAQQEQEARHDADPRRRAVRQTRGAERAECLQQHERAHRAEEDADHDGGAGRELIAVAHAPAIPRGLGRCQETG